MRGFPGVFTAVLNFAIVSVIAAFNGTRSNKGLSVPATIADLTACASQPVTFSCENTTAIQNTCCSPTPGGLVLQTQFWSTYTGLEDKGQKLPKNSWTIHGLWPDNCDGSFEQYCDFSRQYDPAPSPKVLPNGTEIPVYTGPGVHTFIKKFGRDDLLDYMNKYWINQGFPNEELWAHEFSKHATCTSTFDLACYGESYKEHSDVINYFDATIRAFHQYPTFDMLAAFGILPSNRTAYSLESIQNALKTQTGVIPYLGCRNKTILSEVWYFSHIYGTEQYGTYKTLDSTTPSSCVNNESIWYYERTPSAEKEVRKFKW
ncbi:ribonuclease t2 [Moniliophthora roreri MCA 2997]|uniref:ribonuclease T2 n=1 Tax=Moniliophthora roreri (strain MCA 2997) TaxID=1381753 RepID=V2XWM7_MONRO|nr:ribonuclease t2 [Moniliophthora roreri MCA 2997]